MPSGIITPYLSLRRLQISISTLAQRPSLPKIPIPAPLRIVENSLARKCALDRLKKNCFWASELSNSVGSGWF
jgi:hypothetical protein